VLRDRLLEISGFAVLPLSYKELEGRRGGTEADMRWLEEQLVQAAMRPPSVRKGPGLGLRFESPVQLSRMTCSVKGRRRR
jgi:hypothetical protein